MKAIIMGASSGMGYEVARILIAKGWTVGVAARRIDWLQDLNAACTKLIDVTSDEADTRLREMIEDMGGIDLYFHVAGIGYQNRTLEKKTEMDTVTTNGIGFARMIGEAYRYFASVGKGHIACISSIAGTKGLGPAPSYSATKAFQNTYMQALEQLAHINHLNIRFTDIRPGFVDTALLRGNFKYPMILKPQTVAKEIVSAIEHKDHIHVVDWKWRIVTWAWRIVPNVIWRRFKL